MAKEYELKTISKMYKPTISLNEKELPQVKSWQVGKKYRLVVEVEMVALRHAPDYSIEMPMNSTTRMQPRPKIMQGEFEIKAIGEEAEND